MRSMVDGIPFFDLGDVGEATYSITPQRAPYHHRTRREASAADPPAAIHQITRAPQPIAFLLSAVVAGFWNRL